MSDSRPSSRPSSSSSSARSRSEKPSAEQYEGFVALGSGSSSAERENAGDDAGDFGADWTDDEDDIDLDALLARAKLSAAKRAKRKQRKSASKSASPADGDAEDAVDAERDAGLDILLFEEDASKGSKLPPLDPGALPAPYIEWDKKKGLTIRNLDAELLIESTTANAQSSSYKHTLDADRPVASSSKLQIAAPAPPEPAFELDAKGKRVTKRDKKERKTATAGPGWFDLPAPSAAELPRLHREVDAMRLRNQLDPKRFYRKEDGEGKGIKGLPKYFAIGKIVSTPSPFGAASADNLPRAERKRMVVDELVDDAEARRYAKRKFGEFNAGREARGRRTLRDKKAARQGKW
ncbi:Fcf2-domain-containing protein [Auricularia subglabra TFB-10046 SS5]|nr:Fcf2-domain-containing protein [Auricularia subglabra TFB-10046 SS5]